MARLGNHKSAELVVLDLSTSANIDLAGVRMLRGLSDEIAAIGATLALADVHGDVRDLLQAEGLGSRIPGILQRMRIADFIGQLTRTTHAAG